MDLPYSTDELPTAFEGGYESDQHVCQVAIEEYEVTDSGERLVAYGLGSCLGVALFDEKESIAGLIHVKRPTAPSGTTSSKATFADTGIRMLFDEMQSKGATTRHTKATLAGGIDTGGAASAVNMSIGKKNVNQAKQTLDELGITVLNTAVGGDKAMSIHFDGGSGEASIETDSTS